MLTEKKSGGGFESRPYLWRNNIRRYFISATA
jgi:hypothetical protein